jgi:predicted nucleic acid-binding Zn ribbon protein
MMTTYVYKCPTHDEFDLVRERVDDLAFGICPKCGEVSTHVVKIAAAFVPGGTGAGKDMHLDR